jgi:hypothetical protein
MRAWTPLILAFYAALAFAQNNKINVPAGQNTLTVIAGQLTTITWTDPSSGTVTIKLQQPPITPGGGYVLACVFQPFPCPQCRTGKHLLPQIRTLADSSRLFSRDFRL